MASSGPQSKQPIDPKTQHTQDAHRRRVTMIGIAAAAVLLAIMTWAVSLIIEQQRIERCLATRRTDCLRIETAPDNRVVSPAR